MSDERKVSIKVNGDTKFNKTETTDGDVPDTIGYTTTTLVNTSNVTSTSIHNIMAAKTEELQIRNSLSTRQAAVVESHSESKKDELHPIEMPDLRSILLRQVSDGPVFDIGLDNDWDREDDETDEESDDDTDEDLPGIIPGGMPVGGFSPAGDDDDSDSDDLPLMVPGLIRQNGYYRAETSSDYMTTQRAA